MITNSWVEMIFWDVQHGNAAYIKSPNNKHIIIDCGIGSYDDDMTRFSPLTEIRNNYGVTELDFAVITHPHLDHIDDIDNLLPLHPKMFGRPNHLTDADIFPPAIKELDRPIYETYIALSKAYNLPVSPPDPRAITPDNFGGLEIKCFTPTSCNRNNINNHSIVTVFKYAGIKVVVPGDNETESLQELLANDLFVEAIEDADILLAPHHGRLSGYYDDFVNLIYPKLTIVSVGSLPDTTANHRYSAKSQGWDVYKNGTAGKRKCLTTNSDGEIFVKFGYGADGGRFLNVKIK